MQTKNYAVVFDRVSSRDQRDGFSLDAQKTLGEKYAAEKKLRIVKHWSVDESASKEDDRKHFFEMIEYIKANGIKDIIFDKIDRACRGFKSATMIEALIEDGVRFHFTRDHLIIDSSSPPQEKLRFYLGTILGKYYIDNLKTEINKGLEARRQVGLWNCKAPFGYKNIRTGSDKKAIVVQDEITAPLVKEIFQLYSTGNYPLMFFVDLIQKKAGRKVTKRVVEEMLNNPFYYGVMRVKNQLIPGVHEPLIEKKLWENCQKVRGIRAATHNTTRKGTIHKPFMGLLNCGVCGHQITGESKVKASGRTYIYYRCANQSCEEKRKVISQEKLLEQIVAAFEPFAKFTPKATRAFIDSLHQRMSELDLYTQKKTGELAEKRLQIKDSIKKLDQLRVDGILSDSEHKEFLAVKEAALEETKIEIDAHNEADHQTFKEGLRVIELFINVWNFMQKPGKELEKARLAKWVLSNPTLTDRTLQFHYEKPFDVLLQLAGQHIWWRLA